MEIQQALKVLESGRNIIVTGEKHSGKTSFCRELIRQSPVGTWGGILSCTIKDGHRIVGYRLEHILSGECRTALREIPGYSTDQGGGIRFIPDEPAFQWAVQSILKDEKKHVRYICIDEIGPLELQGRGLYDSIRSLGAPKGKTYALVVRRSLLERVRETFGLSDYEIISL